MCATSKLLYSFKLVYKTVKLKETINHTTDKPIANILTTTKSLFAKKGLLNKNNAMPQNTGRVIIESIANLDVVSSFVKSLRILIQNNFYNKYNKIILISPVARFRAFYIKKSSSKIQELLLISKTNNF